MAIDDLQGYANLHFAAEPDRNSSQLPDSQQSGPERFVR